METIAAPVLLESLLYVRGFADVFGSFNLVIRFLLIILTSITDFYSARNVLLGELVLMSCLLIVAVFNTINVGSLVDAAPPTSFGLFLS